MKLEELVFANRLFETYKFCLSALQTELLEDMLVRGLQVGEIAEQKNITKQAVSKHIRLATNKLKSMEQNLGFLAWQGSLKQDLGKLLDMANEKELDKLVQKLQNMMRGL